MQEINNLTDEKVLQVQHHYINQDNGEVVDIWVDIPMFVEESK